MSLIPGRHRNKPSYRPSTGKKSKIKTEKSKMVPRSRSHIIKKWVVATAISYATDQPQEKTVKSKMVPCSRSHLVKQKSGWSPPQ
jgi:hypothetical protein